MKNVSIKLQTKYIQITLVSNSYQFMYWSK